MIFVGIDPSFRCTGISIFDDEKKCFYIYGISANKVAVKNFSNIAIESIKQSERVMDVIKSYRNLTEGTCFYVISETPPPVGIFSAGLFSLDTILFYKISKMADIVELHALPCTYVRCVHGKKYKKSDSTKLAMDILSNTGCEWIATGKNGKVKKCGRINNDMAESFLFLCRLLVMNNCDVNIDTEKYKGLTVSRETIFKL